MSESRQQARWRRRRIIYNNDGDDVIPAENRHDQEEELLVRGEGELLDDFINARSGPLAGTQVDSNWYASCMAGQIFSHHTKLGGFYNKGIPKALVEQYGRDSLQIQTDFSHENNMEAFWSLRMNDVHDAYPMGSRRWTYGLAPFKQDHPEYMFGTIEDWDEDAGPKRHWTGLDFAFPEVRDHVFGTIEEVARNYDVEGIELDFLRHYPYFRESHEMLPVDDEHVQMMTGLMRRIRSLADDVSAQRGRPLLVAVRTPYTVDYARFIGLDLQAWLSEGLLDLFVPGGGNESVMTESFAGAVELGHKHDVPVYPCLGWGFWNHWAYLALSKERHSTFDEWLQAIREEKRNFSVSINDWGGTLPSWRAAAANLHHAGADGIYTFNGFFASPEIWTEIGAMETMAGKDKLFGVEQFGGESSFSTREDKRRELLTPGEPVNLHFQVGEEPSSSRSMNFRLHLWELTDKDDLRIALNGKLLTGLEPSRQLGAQPSGCWLEEGVSEDDVKAGRNQLELILERRNESVRTDLVLDAAQLEMRF